MIRLSIIVLVLSMGAVCSYKQNKPPRGTGFAPEQSLPRRWLQDDNKNNMNKNEPSPIPSQVPSIQPSDSPLPSPSPTSSPSMSPRPTTDRPTSLITPSPSRVPSVSPSMDPSSRPSRESPTFSPSPPPPSSSPSNSPSISGILGFLTLQFSLLEPSLSVGKQSALVGTVVSTVEDYLCQDTDFALVQEDGVSVCATRRLLQARRVLQDDNIFSVENSKTIIRSDQLEPVLQDKMSEEFNYTLWSLKYPVVQVGMRDFDMAEENNMTPFEWLERVAQLALDVHIQTGEFSESIAHLTSVVGHEVATWNECERCYAPLDPDPMHPLRIVGIVLFIISCLFTWMILHMASKRRIEREWDAEYQERGKGGLVTEEGVDFMLAAGRHQMTEGDGAATTSVATTPTPKKKTTDNIEAILDDDEDDRRLPLPGQYQMNVELYGATSSAVGGNNTITEEDSLRSTSDHSAPTPQRVNYR